MTRFSPSRGTESAMVAMATSFRKEGTRLRFRRRRCASGSSVVAAADKQQCVSQFEGDGCAAERFERVGAVCLGRIEYGHGFGDAHRMVREMVVGDDEVHSQGFCLGGGGEGADAGVYADDETDAGGGGLSQDAGLHAVAFAQAVGDVVGDDGGSVFGGDPFDGGLEQDGGGGSVDVVVAVDEDGFAGADGVLDAGYGQVHAQHEHGVDEVVEGWVEEGLGGCWVRDASCRAGGWRWRLGSEGAPRGVRLRRDRPLEVSIAAAQRGRRTWFVYSSLSRLSTTMPPRSETVSIRFWKLSYQSVATSKMNMTPWCAKPSWR